MSKLTRMLLMVSLIAACGVQAGCMNPQLSRHTTVAQRVSTPKLPSLPQKLPNSPLVPIEMVVSSSPAIPPSALQANALDRLPPHGVTEAHVLEASRKSSTSAALLAVSAPINASSPEKSFLTELQPILEAEAKNRSAAEAGATFYQLAELEGRIELIRSTIEATGKMIVAAERARKSEARLPVEIRELQLQQASTISALGQAVLGAKLLEVDLRRRTGSEPTESHRLQPTGQFVVNSTVIDPEPEVQAALQNRPDLQALRLMYHRLCSENVTVIKSHLKSTQPSIRLLEPPSCFGVRRYLLRMKNATDEQVETLRHQLFVVIEEKERYAADEVRAAVSIVNEQAKQAGLARWRLDVCREHAAKTASEGRGVFFEIPAEIETLKAQAELVTAVMNWHQAQIRLRAATGSLSDTSDR